LATKARRHEGGNLLIAEQELKVSVTFWTLVAMGIVNLMGGLPRRYWLYWVAAQKNFENASQ